jgi:hypothetical protein
MSVCATEPDPLLAFDGAALLLLELSRRLKVDARHAN